MGDVDGNDYGDGGGGGDVGGGGDGDGDGDVEGDGGKTHMWGELASAVEGGRPSGLARI